MSTLGLLYFSLFIEFIGVTLSAKLYRCQVHNSTTHHLYTVLCVHHLQSSFFPSLFIPLYPPPLASTPIPPGYHYTVVPVYEFSLIFFFFSLNPSTTLQPAPHPSCLTSSSLLSIYAYVFILLVSSFCSLDSTYEWNHKELVFPWQAYFTEHNAVQIHLLQNLRFPSYLWSSSIPLCKCTRPFLSTHLLTNWNYIKL